MTPVENLFGGRILFNSSQVEILPEDNSGSTVVASGTGHLVAKPIKGYPTNARQFLIVKKPKDGNSEQTRGNTVAGSNTGYPIYARYINSYDQLRAESVSSEFSPSLKSILFGIQDLGSNPLAGMQAMADYIDE